MCLICSVLQMDLFADDAVGRVAVAPRRLPVVGDREMRASVAPTAPAAGEEPASLPVLLERLAGVSARPRYTFMVLKLIARAAGASNSAGPYVRENGQAIPVRDWLSDAMLPATQSDARRLAVVEQVRRELSGMGLLPQDEAAADRLIAEGVRDRLRHSGRTNVSRAVSDLVRAGMLRRHYQGYRVDHCNRGAQREAVYTIVPAVRQALSLAA